MIINDTFHCIHICVVPIVLQIQTKNHIYHTIPSSTVRVNINNF